MLAVVEIAGKQFSVKENAQIKVPLLSHEVGASVTFEKVLLCEKDGKTVVGQPMVENASITATVVGHGKLKKVFVYKKKRRKDYRKKTGHRQDFSLIKIDSISAN